MADRIGIGKGITGTVISGIGRMGGHNVVVARSYSLERRGALTYADGVRLAESADLARRLRIPLVFIVASSGADVLDGVGRPPRLGQGRRRHRRPAAASCRC